MLLFSLLQNPLILVGWLLGLIIAITVHEFFHAFTAEKLGDPTAKYLGRLTLNPLAHLDPLGTLFLLFVGFGWGKPVPYNPGYIKSGKWGELLVALSGPISNLVLAFIFAIPYRFAIHSGVDVTVAPWIIITQTIVELNLFLAIFNILPVPPLDGSKILYLFLPENSKRYLDRVGPYFIIGLFLIIFVLKIDILSYFFTPVFHWLKYLVNSFP